MQTTFRIPPNTDPRHRPPPLRSPSPLQTLHRQDVRQADDRQPEKSTIHSSQFSILLLNASFTDFAK